MLISCLVGDYKEINHLFNGPVDLHSFLPHFYIRTLVFRQGAMGGTRHLLRQLDLRTVPCFLGYDSVFRLQEIVHVKSK